MWNMYHSICTHCKVPWEITPKFDLETMCLYHDDWSSIAILPVMILLMCCLAAKDFTWRYKKMSLDLFEFCNVYLTHFVIETHPSHFKIKIFAGFFQFPRKYSGLWKCNCCIYGVDKQDPVLVFAINVDFSFTLSFSIPYCPQHLFTLINSFFSFHQSTSKSSFSVLTHLHLNSKISCDFTLHYHFTTALHLISENSSVMVTRLEWGVQRLGLGHVKTQSRDENSTRTKETKRE
ncbi:hypothetical protein QQ045_002642 [Rhodiola kirilowii]